MSEIIEYDNAANGSHDKAMILPTDKPNWYRLWWLNGMYYDEQWVMPGGHHTQDLAHPDTLAYIVNGLIFLPADGQAGPEGLLDDEGMPDHHAGWYEATTGKDAIIWPDGTLVILA
ncbi:MAG: hypothetical protein C4534_08160 [Gaiellales bacterium]|nr:MAG: hypothetical protein C4534_08160 [Gaiellales bacterium]